MDAGRSTFAELSAKDQHRFSISRGISDILTSGGLTGLEREVSDAEARRLKVDVSRRGFLVPMDIPLRRDAATLVTGTATIGGNLVFSEVGTFIDLLRAKMACGLAGATFINPPKGPYLAPRIDGAATLSWPGEAPGTDLTETHPAFGQLKLSGYPATCHVDASRQFLLQTSKSTDQLVLEDLARIQAVGLDLVALQGTGTNQPTGILTYSGVGSVTMGTNGGVPTLAKLCEVEKAQADVNADVGRLGWVTTSAVRSKLRQTQDFTDGRPLWGSDDRLLSAPAFSTTQLPSNLTKGTSTTICSALVYGNWADLLITTMGAFEVVVDPYSMAGQGVVRLISYQLVDVGIRHAASFTVVKDLLTA